MNKFQDILTPEQRQEKSMETLTAEDQKFMEQIGDEYYTRVTSSE